MTSFTEDNLNSDLIDGKVLETLLIASAKKLKRENKKFDREEVSKLVNDSLCDKTCKDLFKKTLDSLTENQSVKCNSISSCEFLSLPKDSEIYHRSIKSTQDARSLDKHLTPCHLLDSETNEKRSPFQVYLKYLKFKQ